MSHPRILSAITTMAAPLFSVLLSALAPSQSQACSLHDHGCVFHGFGRPIVQGVTGQNQPTSLTIYSVGNNPSGGVARTDFDNAVLLPDGKGMYIISVNGVDAVRGDQPYIGANERNRTVSANYYSIVFNGNRAIATHSGDFNGGEPIVAGMAGCPSNVSANREACEVVKIEGYIPSGVYKQKTHLYNFHNLANPSVDVTSYAVATGTAVLVSKSHLPGTLISTMHTDTLQGQGAITPEYEYEIRNDGVAPHASGVQIKSRVIGAGRLKRSYTSEDDHFKYSHKVMHYDQYTRENLISPYGFVRNMGETWTGSFDKDFIVGSISKPKPVVITNPVSVHDILGNTPEKITSEFLAGLNQNSLTQLISLKINDYTANSTPMRYAGQGTTQHQGVPSLIVYVDQYSSKLDGAIDNYFNSLGAAANNPKEALKGAAKAPVNDVILATNLATEIIEEKISHDLKLVAFATNALIPGKTGKNISRIIASNSYIDLPTLPELEYTNEAQQGGANALNTVLIAKSLIKGVARSVLKEVDEVVLTAKPEITGTLQQGQSVIKLNPPINITDDGLQHVTVRHINLSSYLDKSKFNPDVDVTSLIKSATQGAISNSRGNLVRTMEATDNIGIDISTGKQTKQFTVVTDVTGNLITAYPGLPLTNP